jgi:hypothetical protein
MVVMEQLVTLEVKIVIIVVVAVVVPVIRV